jgi:hypothetical protein
MSLIFCGQRLILPHKDGMKVNIIGRGDGWQLAPKDEYSWGITLINLSRPVDMVIDMNVYSDGRWGSAERDGAIRSKQVAEASGIEYVDLASYPIVGVMDFFKTDYFSNTVDYAIALAIYKGYKVINLYGVNMSNNTEYVYQKAGVEYWVGRAQGGGIEVNIFGDSSTILRTKYGLVYGYDREQKGRTEWQEQ